MLTKARPAQAKAPAPTAAPRVYSYTRFSSPEQSEGDSQRRQDAEAAAWAAKRELPLDESLRDEGLSGYHGTHRKRGALGTFLATVEAGRVPPGSVLLVENLDRLGREDVLQAFKTVSTLLEHEIKIVTLRPYEEEYTRQSVASGKVWQLVGQMQNAHEESKKKSDRIKQARVAARAAARATGRILTSRCPAWLTVKDGRFEAIPEAAKAIRMIFDLKLKGIGTRTIERRLNETAAWRPPKRKNARTEAGWRASYIKKILGNPAVIGIYQPHVLEGGRGGKRAPTGDPIQGYYPAIIKPEVFYAVQAKLDENRGKGGRNGKVKNLFTHLVKCAYCGGPMAYVDKGPRWVYLVCDNGRRGVSCARHAIRYQACEDAVIANLDRLRPDEVLPNPTEQAATCQALRGRLAGLDGELANIEQQLENLTDQIAGTRLKAARDRYELKIAALAERQEALAADKATAARELAAAETNLQSFAAWQRNFAALREALAAGDVDVRLRLRAHLRDLIDRIEVFAVGHAARHDHEAPAAGGTWHKQPDRGEDLAEYIDAVAGECDPKLAKDKRFCAFLEYVTERRMSKDGWFVRLHYKTGAKADLVPAGSIASGMELCRGKGGGWRFVRPDIHRLWCEFTARNGRKPARGKLVTL